MPDLFENPMGLDGFEFVEFASPEPGVLEPVFHALGFEAVARHRSKRVTLYRQGGINFILNEEPKLARYYLAGVVGGPGSFLLTADDFEDFSQAIRRKLFFEITGPPIAQAPPSKLPPTESEISQTAVGS